MVPLNGGDGTSTAQLSRRRWWAGSGNVIGINAVRSMSMSDGPAGPASPLARATASPNAASKSATLLTRVPGTPMASATPTKSMPPISVPW